MLMNLFRPKGRAQRSELTKPGITVVRKRRPGAVVTGETRTRTTVRSGPRTVVSVRTWQRLQKAGEFDSPYLHLNSMHRNGAIGAAWQARVHPAATFKRAFQDSWLSRERRTFSPCNCRGAGIGGLVRSPPSLD